ncbi:uncharacterized protein LOC109138835 [Tachysurus ichikawai]
MLKLHTKMEDKLLDLESRSRRDNIRIYGVPKGAEKDSTTMVSFVENLLHGGLELTEDMPDLQIERAHRSVGPKPPCSIIIKFLSFKTKETILRKAWQRKGFTWQENHINLDHDYTPLILKKRREYSEIRKVGGIRGPVEKRLHCDNHQTSGDAREANAAVIMVKSGQTSKEGHTQSREGEAHQVSEWDEEGNHIDAKQVFKDSIN